ncbi:DUF2759 domain-containing protein [Niallia endozanthoxylica]|uniref:DUF2759 domain-containing protein n=1 Tax=Niallia endozanthoxylica TaxID=2036016 RepID=A0A5J5HV80_9BACI|nr:DUF2759 domain-containing protein [Niallia endozanthoxylica]KAA9026285.1 DUF2759 domain-containing protein [Niallia endozanthoxylica]
MGTVIIFALVSILAAVGSVSSLKNKNLLGVLFAVGSFAIFGWFAIMTFINSGFPATH